MSKSNKDIIDNIIQAYQLVREPSDEDVFGLVRFYCDHVAQKKDEDFVQYLCAIKDTPLEQVNDLIDELLQRYSGDEQIFSSKGSYLNFNLDGHVVEFKDTYDTTKFYSWDEAMELFGKPDAEGWRLPTKYELDDLCSKYSYEFDNFNRVAVFDHRLILYARGYMDKYVDRVGDGYLALCWTSTPYDSDALVKKYSLCASSLHICVSVDDKQNRLPVILVRTIK